MLGDEHAMSKVKTSSHKLRIRLAGVMFFIVVVCVAVGIWLGILIACDGGYKMIDGKCTNIDECALDTHNCAHKCVDASPGFTCECEFGYTTTNEGVTCTADCEIDCKNGHCIQPNQCTCYVGYRMENATCQNIDECVEHCNECAHACVDTTPGYKCVCENGYDSWNEGRTCAKKLETWQILALIFGTVFVVIIVIAQIRFWGSKMKQNKMKENEEKMMKDSNREIFA